MAENSKIEWTDHTFNPWIGCTKVSPGCDHCYAESMAKRYGWVTWGPHGERKRTSVANWRKPLQWAKAARGTGKRPRVFCASLADVFDNQVPTEWRSDLFTLIASTPELDWLLLTKRPQNLAKMFPVGPWDNIWLGTTAEDQKHYDERWPILAKQRNVPVRFISYEPAIGPMDLFSTAIVLDHPAKMFPDWIICGGESGPGARMMNPTWARDLRDQCHHLGGVAYFFKQMTGKKPIPDDLMIRQFPASGQ
jgi:protein gp37